MTAIRRALVVGVALFATGAAAQQEKAELLVSNFMPGPIAMRVDYNLRAFTWNLVDTSISQGADLRYRFPSALPGCDVLIKAGIDRAILTLSNVSGPLCAFQFSICRQQSESVAVRPNGCMTAN